MVQQAHDILSMSLGADAHDGQFAAVLDAVADGVTVQDPTGRLVYANQAAVRLIGFTSVDELLSADTHEVLARFELFDEDGRPLPLSTLPGRRALQGEAEAEATVGFRIRATGEERWATVRAVPLRGATGEVRFAINTFHDVTDRIRVEQTLRASESRYRQLVEAMPQLAWMTDPLGRIVLVNRRWTEYTGSAVQPGAETGSEHLVHPDDRAAVADAWRHAVDSGETFEATCRVRRRDGVFRWHLVRAVAVRSESGTIEAWIGTSTDFDDAKRAEDGLALLSRASAALDAMLDVDELMSAAVELAVPELADWAVIDLLEPDGSLRRSAVAAGHPDLEHDIDRLSAFPPDPGGSSPAAEALRTGRPVLIESLAAGDIDRMASTPEHLRILSRLGPQSGICLPLAARGRTIGVLQLLAGRSGRRFAWLDTDLASAFAARVALAAVNAQLRGEQQAALDVAEKSARRTDRLARAAGALVGAVARDEVFEIVLRESVEAVGAAGGAVVMRLPDVPEIDVVARHGALAGDPEEWQRMRLSDDIPFAVSVRRGKPVWVADYATDRRGSERVRDVRRTSTNRAACVVPILVENRAVGALGLTFREPHIFDDEERRYIAAYADLAAQALDRVTLTEARESLLAGLDEQRARLETVLRAMPAGVIIAEAPSGRMLLMNHSVEHIWRGGEYRAASIEEYATYQGFHADGRRYKSAEWPLARAITSGEVVTNEEIAIERGDGSRGWILVDAAPVRDRDGRTVAGVVTFSDITDRRLLQERLRFLADAGEVLGSSLDYEETMARVAELAVPGLADFCIVDLVDDDGLVRRIKIAHADPSRQALAERYARTYPPDPARDSGPYGVIRSGQSELMSEVPPDLVRATATSDEQRAMLDEVDIRSYMCVPLRADERIIGAMTFVAAASARRFSEGDLAFAEDLAARAGAAVERARLFRDVGRYKRLVDASLDAVFLIDPSTLGYTYANAGAVDQLGRPADELVRMRVVDVAVDLDEEHVRSLLRPLLDGSISSRTVTINHRHASGKLIPVEVLLQHVTVPGSDGGILAIARDISERVDAQARLQRLAHSEHARAAELNAVIRAMGDGVVVCDGAGRITLANPAAETLFPGVASLSYAAILARLEDPDGGAPKLGKRSGPVELRLSESDPDERWVELSTYPVGLRGDEEGRGDRNETIVLIRDVTEARQRQAVRDTFLGVLSHELRTPITTIYAASQVLARPESGLSDEIRREIFGDIRVEAERLHRLVEDVIAMNRFGEDGGDVGQEPVLLQRLLPGVVASEEPRWPSATFELDMPVGLPTVVADPTYVEQVARNLLSNAAKYAGAGARIEVRVQGDDDEVRVRILDNGPGFPVEESDRLFELYFRSATTAGRASGAGIGLFVCARLIRAMGGRIWARPRAEGGAEFGFSLRVMTDE